MFRSILRKFQKIGVTAQRDAINLDKVSKRLTTRADLSMVFDFKKTETRLGQFFMILGPSEPDATTPSLLLVHPAKHFCFDKDNFCRISQFCFPRGMIKSSDSINQIQDQFVFGLNNDGSLQFGICTHFLVKDNCFLGPSSMDKLYCMCTFTTCPQLNANFHFHSYLVNLIVNSQSEFEVKGNVPLANEAFDVPDEMVHTLESFEPPLKKVGEVFTTITESIPESFMKCVDFYMHVSTLINSSIVLEPSLTVCISKFEHSIKEIANATFDYLFSNLDIKNIVRFMRALLMEEKVLVVGTDLSAVSLVSFSTLALLSPLSYKGALLPILPDREEFLAYVDTPVPFVFGALLSENLAALSISDDVTIINLDKNEVQYPDRMPHMAKVSQMRSDLTEALNSFPKQTINDSYWQERISNGVPITDKRNKKLKHIFLPYQIQVLFDIFNKYIETLIGRERLAGCRVRDTTDPDNPAIGFVKEAYMIEVPDEDYAFVSSFVSTQTFQAYLEDSFFN